MPSLLRLIVLSALTAALPAAAQTPKVEPPVPVRTVEPVYPRDLLDGGVAGVVTVKCTVDVQGNVVETEIVKSSHQAFEKPAVDALTRWKFKPARQDGTAVAMKVSIPVKFVQKG